MTGPGQVLVREAAACEVLGSVTTLITDKARPASRDRLLPPRDCHVTVTGPSREHARRRCFVRAQSLAAAAAAAIACPWTVLS